MWGTGQPHWTWEAGRGHRVWELPRQALSHPGTAEICEGPMTQWLSRDANTRPLHSTQHGHGVASYLAVGIHGIYVDFSDLSEFTTPMFVISSVSMWTVSRLTRLHFTRLKHPLRGEVSLAGLQSTGWMEAYLEDTGLSLGLPTSPVCTFLAILAGKGASLLTRVNARARAHTHEGVRDRKREGQGRAEGD